MFQNNQKLTFTEVVINIKILYSSCKDILNSNFHMSPYNTHFKAFKTCYPRLSIKKEILHRTKI